eukprot:TRINITY_DN8512_c0_g1_i2.p1 TRINITY_DN8512_c0_g1~~TRINITY_DN8512_c0_g1_i2.p1  ORF type:complete len:820 (+),score=131.07 TRINITY_DN8512_c0_g1_i2:45-2504(+)
MIRRPPRSTQSRSSAASDVYKRQSQSCSFKSPPITLNSIQPTPRVLTFICRNFLGEKEETKRQSLQRICLSLVSSVKIVDGISLLISNMSFPLSKKVSNTSPFFFFKQKTAYEIMPSLVGSEMCIRDRYLYVRLLRNWFQRASVFICFAISIFVLVKGYESFDAFIAISFFCGSYTLNEYWDERILRKLFAGAYGAKQKIEDLFGALNDISVASIVLGTANTVAFRNERFMRLVGQLDERKSVEEMRFKFEITSKMFSSTSKSFVSETTSMNTMTRKREMAFINIPISARGDSSDRSQLMKSARFLNRLSPSQTLNEEKTYTGGDRIIEESREINARQIRILTFPELADLVGNERQTFSIYLTNEPKGEVRKDLAIQISEYEFFGCTYRLMRIEELSSTGANGSDLESEIRLRTTSNVYACNKLLSDLANLQTVVREVQSRNLPILTQKSLKKIQGYSESFKLMVGELLDSNLLRVKKLNIKKATVSITNLLATLGDVFETFFERGKLIFEINKDIPSTIFTDETRLKQILYKLCLFVSSFSPRKFLQIKVRTLGVGYIEFSVIGGDLKEQDYEIVASLNQLLLRNNESPDESVEGTIISLLLTNTLLKELGTLRDEGLRVTLTGDTEFKASFCLVALDDSNLKQEIFQASSQDIESRESENSMDIREDILPNTSANMPAVKTSIYQKKSSVGSNILDNRSMDMKLSAAGEEGDRANNLDISNDDRFENSNPFTIEKPENSPPNIKQVIVDTSREEQRSRFIEVQDIKSIVEPRIILLSPSNERRDRAIRQLTLGGFIILTVRFVNPEESNQTILGGQS